MLSLHDALPILALRSKQANPFSGTAGRSPPISPRLLFYAIAFFPAVRRCGPCIVLLLPHSSWLLPYWFLYCGLPVLHPAFQLYLPCSVNLYLFYFNLVFL